MQEVNKSNIIDISTSSALYNSKSAPGLMPRWSKVLCITESKITAETGQWRKIYKTLLWPKLLIKLYPTPLFNN